MGKRGSIQNKNQEDLGCGKNRKKFSGLNRKQLT